MKHLIVLSVLCLFLSNLNARGKDRVEAILDELISFELIETAAHPVSKYDVFHMPKEPYPVFGGDGRLVAYWKTNRSNPEHYKAYKNYESLMYELSSLMSPKLLEKFATDTGRDSMRYLLAEIAYDLSLNKERYRELLEFHNKGERSAIRIRNPNWSESYLETAKLFETKEYLHAWAYYLYAPEVVETYWLNELQHRDGTRGGITRVLGDLDEGRFYSFVLRRLENDLLIYQKKEAGWHDRERSAQQVLLYYLIQHPNEETLSYLMRFCRISGEYTEYDSKLKQRVTKADFSKAKSFGVEFAKALKSKHREQQAAWETLVEEADQEDEAFAEFLKSYHSNP